MDALLYWIANGLAGLFFIACLVAWCEHMARGPRWQPEGAAAPRPPVKVDIALDEITAVAGDIGERHSTLVGAMSRMADPAPRAGWIETAPMVLPGRRDEAESSSAPPSRV